MKLKKEVISLVLAGSLVLGGVSYLPNGGAAGSVAAAAESQEVTRDDVVGKKFWGPFTDGVKLSAQETTFSFKATTDAKALNEEGAEVDVLKHDCPYAVLFSASDGKVNGTAYSEYYVMRSDAHGWKGTAVSTEPELKSEGTPVGTADTSSEWKAWIAELQKGVECSGSVKLDGDNAVLKLVVNGVTSTVAVPVTAGKDVYIALSAEYCTLSQIKFVVPKDAAGTTTGSGTTTTGGSTNIPSNPGSNGGSTNTNPGTTSTTAPGATQAPAASQAPTTSQAPSASDAPAASQAPGASDAPAVSQAPDATQAPDITPDATQKPSGGDDDDKNTSSKNDKEPVKKNNATAKKQNGVTLKVDTKKNGTATISTVKKTNKTTVTISATVTVNGVKYKVTTIGANAFKNCAKVKTVNLPSSVTTISKNAFAGAKNLKTIKITSKKAVTVKKGAFKGLNTKKMTVKVSKKMSKKQFNKMKKNLKKAGFKGKVKRV